MKNFKNFILVLLILICLMGVSSAEVLTDRVTYTGTDSDSVNLPSDVGNDNDGFHFNYLEFNPNIPLSDYQGLDYCGLTVYSSEYPSVLETSEGENWEQLLDQRGMTITLYDYTGTDIIGTGTADLYLTEPSLNRYTVEMGIWWNDIDIDRITFDGQRELPYDLSGGHDYSFYNTRAMSGFGNYAGDARIINVGTPNSVYEPKRYAGGNSYASHFSNDWSFEYYSDYTRNEVNKIDFIPSSTTAFNTTIDGNFEEHYTTETVIKTYFDLPIQLEVSNPITDDIYSWNIDVDSITGIDLTVFPDEVEINKDFKFTLEGITNYDEISQIKYKPTKWTDENYGTPDTNTDLPIIIYDRLDSNQWMMSYVAEGNYNYNVSTLTDDDVKSADFTSDLNMTLVTGGYYTADCTIKYTEKPLKFVRKEFLVNDEIHGYSTATFKTYDNTNGNLLSYVDGELFSSIDGESFNYVRDIVLESGIRELNLEEIKYYYVNYSKSGYQNTQSRTFFLDGNELIKTYLPKTGDESKGTFRIYTYDQDGNQLELCKFEVGEIVAYSPDNYYTRVNTDFGTYNYTISKDGYETVTGSITLNQIYLETDITLYKKDSAITPTETGEWDLDEPDNILESIKYGFAKIFGFDGYEKLQINLLFALIIILACVAMVVNTTKDGYGAMVGGMIGFVLCLALDLIPIWVLFVAIACFIMLYVVIKGKGE